MGSIVTPMVVIKKIEDISIFGTTKYNDGDIFNFEEENIIHIALREHGYFSKLENDRCEFTNMCPGLEINGEDIALNEVVDISNITDEALNNLCKVGYIKKTLKPQAQEKTEIVAKKVIKKTIKKKTTLKTYSGIAKELKIENKKFKALYKKAFDEDIKDMRKSVSKKIEKTIVEALT